MKADIHPKYHEITVSCGCGNQFTTGSTRAGHLSVEVCSACHPHFTGKQRVLDTEGRVDAFKNKFSGFGQFKKK
jgi:large subunit ribosomal protein L31